MKTKLLAILAATTAIATTAQAEEVIFAHGANPGNPRYVAAEKWAEVFAECTGGNHSVNVAPSAMMGNDVEMLTSATAGVIQISANSQGAMSQIVPEIGLLGLPFLFEDLPAAWKVLDGEVGEMLDARAQDSGLKILGFWDNGIRNITHVSKNVSEPSDLAGMKIRTPPDQMTVDIFEALGAAPAPLAWSELPTALQSGVFDGQENPLTNIYSAKLHEITPYVTMTGHKYESTPVVAGLAWWSGLDEETQTCAIEATAEAGELQREMSQEGDQTLKPKMEEEGATFADANRDAYIEATASVYDKYAADFPELVAALKEAAGQ
ncbi:2,3-diketo-L-gulonate-binding periplasmic protein YiaO precursor [Roseovarius sp. THAF9]|uniref:TRAP transporter substrate-binding protein n=1 Tax=Roseovarius sp. THAF9 TaxID=2587847 RepID=UPI00126929C8|nr:TRAP transporter substrate-binding protein [Roseovarius sp. THAF9]QFT93588.1 2,3-diketo-L-gulonate-binding periplasmic protein YiaO precursor [Roseovarius sp. THAF9]